MNDTEFIDPEKEEIIEQLLDGIKAQGRHQGVQYCLLAVDLALLLMIAGMILFNVRG